MPLITNILLSDKFGKWLLPIFQNIIASIIDRKLKGVFGRKDSLRLDDIIHKTFEKVIEENVRNGSIAESMKQMEEKDFKALLDEELKTYDEKDGRSIHNTRLFGIFKDELYSNPSFALRILIRYGRECNKRLQDYWDVIAGEIERLKRIESQLSTINEAVNALACQRPFVKSIEVTGVENGVSFCPLHESYATRSNYVDSIKRELLQYRIICLHGPIYSGKSVLSCLVAKQLCGARKVRVPYDYQNVYDISSILKLFNPDESTIFILDAVPYSGASEVEGFFRVLTECISKTKWCFIVTSRVKLSSCIMDPTISLHEMECGLLSVEDLREIGNHLGANINIADLIYANTCGQPYLSFLFYVLNKDVENIDVPLVEKCLKLPQSIDIQNKVRHLFDGVLQDSEDYHLLNRLAAISGPFTDEDVKKMAELAPMITNPLGRLSHLVGPFVDLHDGKYKISDLARITYKPDMPDVEMRACYKLLADKICVSDGSVTAIDIVKKILYLIQAGCYDEAAIYYILSLNKLAEQGNLSRPSVLLLTSLWIGVALPSDMDYNLKVYVRLAQLMYLTDLPAENKNSIASDILEIIKKEKTGDFHHHLLQVSYEILMLNGFLDLASEAMAIISSRKTSIEELGTLPNVSIWMVLHKVENVEGLFNWIVNYKKQGCPEDEYSAEAAYSVIKKITTGFDSESLAKLYERIVKESNDDLFAISITAIQIHEAGLHSVIDAETLYAQRKTLLDNDFGKVVINYAMYCVYSGNAEELKKKSLLEEICKVGNLKLHCMTSLHAATYLSELLYKEGTEEFYKPLENIVNNGNFEDCYFSSERAKCYGELAVAFWLAGEKEKSVRYLVLVEQILWDLQSNLDDDIKETVVKLSAVLVQFNKVIKTGVFDQEEVVPQIGLFISDSPKMIPEYGYFRYYTNSFLLYSISNHLGISGEEEFDIVYSHALESSTSSLNEHGEFASLLLETYHRSLVKGKLAEALYQLNAAASCFYADEHTHNNTIDTVLINSLVFLALFIEMQPESLRENTEQQVLSYIRDFKSYCDTLERIETIYNSFSTRSTDPGDDSLLSLVATIRQSSGYRSSEALTYLYRLLKFEKPVFEKNALCRIFFEKYSMYYLSENIRLYPSDYSNRDECVRKLNLLTAGSKGDDTMLKVLQLMHFYLRNTDGISSEIEDALMG